MGQPRDEDSRTLAVLLAFRARYAPLPEVALRSPKLSRNRTTTWYARSVDRRFQQCMARYAAKAK